MPTIYRVDFFNELGKYCNLTVLFERFHATGVKNKWDKKMAVNFKAVFTKNISIGREGAIGIRYLFYDYGKYDCVVVSSYSSPSEMIALLRLKTMSIPYILEIDGGFINYNESKLKHFIKNKLISGATTYFSTSNIASEYLIYYGAKENKIVKYPFTSLHRTDILDTPVSNIKKVELRKKMGIIENKVVLAVGQFIPRKGFDVLLKCASNLVNNIGFYFVGGEPTREYIQIKERLELSNVHFVGVQPKEKLKEYYQAADVFVLPTREDVWGLVINEAMANGLPVISTDKCGAALELIDDGENGFIVPANDEKMLLERIKILIADTNMQRRFGEYNLKTIKEYTMENMAIKHRSVFAEKV